MKNYPVSWIEGSLNSGYLSSFKNTSYLTVRDFLDNCAETRTIKVYGEHAIDWFHDDGWLLLVVAEHASEG